MVSQNLYQNMSPSRNCDSIMERSLLPATVGTQDVVTLGEEATSHQRHRTLHAGETLAVPLALLKGDVLSTCQTGDGLGAAHAFLCIQVADAFKAVGVVFPGGEALTRQLLSAADAQETLSVPGLLLVGHSTCCDGLLTSTTLVGKLLLEARHTEVAGVFWDKGLGSYWLLAAVAQEAGLMPAVPLVFHFAGTWHYGFLAVVAFGGIIICMTFRAEQQIIFNSKGLFHQRAAALPTLKTLLMPVMIFVGQILGIAAYW